MDTRLKDLFDYDPSGFLVWKKPTSNVVKPGQKAGSVDPRGYIRVSFDGQQYYLHRVIYAWHTGDWPDIVDHINQDKADNRIENLRAVSKSLNTLNSSSIRGVVPIRGVHLDRHGTYVASLGGNRKSGFKTAEEAEEYLIQLREMKGIKL